ncbi:beta-defensin 115 [Diceros bicornis minor]|uniref:beta-defensin 115 n=1 Tax=Diceros bicornis minor TaxID=77932 RepID=UPI0026EDA7B9|nr:beta-defensin 115 [Diceros bicornis minor]
MLLDHSSPLSGYSKLLFLALAVLVVLAQASPDGWVKKCSYRIGRCRKSCKSNEKKKEKCGARKLCCIPAVRRKTSYLFKKQETPYKAMASPLAGKVLLANQT